MYGKRIHDFSAALPQIKRYVLGGATSAVLCFGSLAFFKEVCGINYLVSANLSGGLTYVYSYVVNKYLVFRNRKNTHVRHGAKFIALQAFLWVLSNAILVYGVEFFKIHYLLMVIAIAGLNAFLNFISMKFFVFT